MFIRGAGHHELRPSADSELITTTAAWALFTIPNHKVDLASLGRETYRVHTEYTIF